MHREDDERILLIQEVEVKTIRISHLVAYAIEQEEIIKSQESIITNLNFIVDKQKNKVQELNGLYDSSFNMNKAYDTEIKDLQWKLTKEKVKNKWLSVGGGLTGGLLLAVIVRELLRN